MTNKKYSVVKQFGTNENYYTIFSDNDQYCDEDGNPIRYDDYDEAKQKCGELNYPDTQWERYLKYLMMSFVIMMTSQSITKNN